ncbi:MAG TPA: amidoligase family protein [Balneolaceae bacterium]
MMKFKQPEITNNAEGQPRTVGLELEFAGVEIDRAADIITTLYGGKVDKENRYEIEITDTELGDFRVELDARLLKKMADKSDISLEGQSVRKSIEEAVEKLAKTVVPFEIVMPPVAVEKLDRLEALREALQKNRAEGTKSSLVHAFGMHINIESPDLETVTLLKYLRAFLIIYPWLIEKLNIDISRRITPFVFPFAEKYVRKVLNPSYQPDEDQFIKDYVDFNPTRNRPLDMMPIFGMLNERLIQPVMEGEKNNERPTFHYRLPNSKIEDPDWRFEDEWDYWLVVEKLADDDVMLEKLCRLYLLRERETIISFHKEWAKTVTILLNLDEQ